MRAVLVAMLCAALSIGAHAAEPKLDCKEPTETYELRMCATEELAKAKAELSTVFERALKAAEEQYESVRHEPGFENMPNMPEELRKAQQAWEAYRDLNCGYQRLVYYGGSMASIAALSCWRDMTRARMKELNELIEPQ